MFVILSIQWRKQVQCIAVARWVGHRCLVIWTNPANGTIVAITRLTLSMVLWKLRSFVNDCAVGYLGDDIYVGRSGCEKEVLPPPTTQFKV